MPEPFSEHQPQRGRLQRILWPGIIFFLLGGQIVLMCVMVYLATSDASFAVEPDYYQKGLNWDATAAQLRANAKLGWSIKVEWSNDSGADSQTTMRCILTDRVGEPVKGAVVDVVAFPHVRATQRSSAALLPVGDGVYQAKLHFPHKGKWEFRFVATREADTFTDMQLHDIYPPGETEPWRR